MAGSLEIERKFLVRGTDWGPPRSTTDIAQGYLMLAPDRSLRIRRKGDRYILTFKAAAGGGARHEFEYEVPPADGQAMLARLCTEPPIEKRRHDVDYAGLLWEIDVFTGANAGLIVAEVELDAPDAPVTLPPWAGPEVTDDPRFYNANLYTHPFTRWGVDYSGLLTELA